MRITTQLPTRLRRIGLRKAGAGLAVAVGLAGAVLSFSSASIGAEPGLARSSVVPNHSGYRMLRFTGAPMKWGAGRLGTPAVVTWRMAEQTTSFEGARNCGTITPMETALAPSGITKTAFLLELDAAMRMWSDVAGLAFRPARAGERADLVLGAQREPRGRAFTNVSATRMVKVGNRRRIDRLDQAVICLNPKRPWKIGFDGDLKVYDLRHTLAHEIGHVIGLDHVGATGAVMGFRYDEAHTSLAAGDVIGVQRLYGLPTYLRKPAVTLVSARRR